MSRTDQRVFLQLLPNLELKLPSWNSPSIFVPGSYFISDVVRGFQEDDFLKGLSRAAGVRFLEGRPTGTERGIKFGQDVVDAGFGWLNELNPLP